MPSATLWQAIKHDPMVWTCNAQLFTERRLRPTEAPGDNRPGTQPVRDRKSGHQGAASRRQRICAHQEIRRTCEMDPRTDPEFQQFERPLDSVAPSRGDQSRCAPIYRLRDEGSQTDAACGKVMPQDVV